MAVATLVSCRLFSNPTTNPETGVLLWLPAEISGHSGTRSEMGDAERKWLPRDTGFLKMVYRERGLPEGLANYRSISATLIVAGSDSRSLHRPQVCLTAQGWTIAKREIVSIETEGGLLQVMDFSLSRFLTNEDGSARLDDDGNKIAQRAHYFYWWVGPHGSTPSDEERVWKSVWSSIIKGQNERWAYPSVMVLVDERMVSTGVEEARARAQRFIKKYAPKFQKSLGAHGANSE